MVGLPPSNSGSATIQRKFLYGFSSRSTISQTILTPKDISRRDAELAEKPLASFAALREKCENLGLYGAPLEDIDELLRTAIGQRRLIQLTYYNKPRIVEPHDYGVHNGSVKLLAYQVGGASSGPLPNWRWMEVKSISDVRLLERTFRGGRPAPSGKHHQWDELFVRVKEPDEK